MSAQNLKLWFQKAGLHLKLEKEPLMANDRNANSKDIFQFGIEVKPNGKELFRLYEGHEDNIVQVVDTDKKLNQLILMVKEPKRSYQVYNRNTEKYETRFTPEELRKYLVGEDECYLFISELPSKKKGYFLPHPVGAINTVKDAHRVLKPKELQYKKSTYKRQGEWFFINTTSEEDIIIEENTNLIKKKRRIGGRGHGHSHIADQMLSIDDKTFVKGKIKHTEHHTLVLNGWYRVERNLEQRQSFLGGTGIPRVVGFVD